MYKKGIVVVSVPITMEVNRKLYELAAANAYRNKTQLASRILELAVEERYKALEEQRKNGTQ